MSLLQRYILTELLRVFAFLLSVLTVLLVFVGILGQMREIQLGPLEVVKILPYVVPSLMPFTIPATLLLSVCVVYGRMAGDQEITAAKAAGINVMSLIWPALVLAGLLSICSLLLTDRTIPWAMQNITGVITRAMEKIFLDQLRSMHSFNDRDRGFAINVRDVRGKTLIHPIFQYTPPGKSTVIVQADEATIDFDMKKKQVMLHLVNAYADMPGRRRARLKQEDYPFPLPFKMEDPKPRHLTIRDINARVRKLDTDLERRRQQRDIETACLLLVGDFERLALDELGQYERHHAYHFNDLAKFRTEIHSRFALSASCVFFVLLGAPFSIMQAKRQFLTSFFLCFLPILIVYYPIALLMMTLARADSVHPVWSAWVANTILCVGGMYTLRKVLQH